MKIKIEIVNEQIEDEIIIKCAKLTDEIKSIQSLISETISKSPEIAFFKSNEQYFLQLNDIYFFETNDENVYAHTADDAYRIKLKLYELENILPSYFSRVSKSTIVNARHILSINKNLTSSSLIHFHKSHKQIYVSRFYFKPLKQKINERGHNYD